MTAHRRWYPPGGDGPLGEHGPHLDVMGPLEQTLVELPRPVKFLLLYLKVYVGLPQHLWHVQFRLTNGQLEDGPPSVHISQDGLQLTVLQVTGGDR